MRQRRYHYNPDERELDCLVYPIDIGKQLYFLVYTYFAPFQPGHVRLSIHLQVKRSVWYWPAQNSYSVLNLVGFYR
jgi:hypothetical protein